MFQRGAYWFSHLSDKKDAVAAAQTVDDVALIDWE
jgi:hypothetical protein